MAPLTEDKRIDWQRLVTMALGVALLIAGNVLSDSEMRSAGLLLLGVASPWPGDIVSQMRMRKDRDEKADALKEIAPELTERVKARVSKRTRDSIAKVSEAPALPLKPPPEDG